MKRELLDLAKEREQQCVSKWAVTDRGILALLAEGPLVQASHSFPTKDSCSPSWISKSSDDRMRNVANALPRTPLGK